MGIRDNGDSMYSISTLVASGGGVSYSVVADIG